MFTEAYQSFSCLYHCILHPVFQCFILNGAFISCNTLFHLYLFLCVDVGSLSNDIPPEIVVPPSHTVAVQGDDAVVLECVANARYGGHC